MSNGLEISKGPGICLFGEYVRIYSEVVTEQFHEIRVQIFEDIQATCIHFLTIAADCLEMFSEVFWLVKLLPNNICTAELENRTPSGRGSKVVRIDLVHKSTSVVSELIYLI